MTVLMRTSRLLFLIAALAMVLPSCETSSSKEQEDGLSYTYLETGWHHGWGGPRVLRGARGLH